MARADLTRQGHRNQHDNSPFVSFEEVLPASSREHRSIAKYAYQNNDGLGEAKLPETQTNNVIEEPITLTGGLFLQLGSCY